MLQEPTSSSAQRVFENPFLENFTRINPRIAFATYPVVSAGLFISSFYYTRMGIETALMFFGFGLVFWTLFEYLVHRFVFHIHGGDRTSRFQYIVHGVHHSEPKDETRLIMPPIPYLLIVSVLFLVFYAIMGGRVMAFLPGMLIGHLAYVYVHYKIHLPNPPRYFRKALKHHNLHHYKYHDKCFGVSTTLWDHVFGTMPPKRTSSAQR